MRKVVLIDDDATTNYLNKLVIERSEMVDDVVVFHSANEALAHYKAHFDDFDGALILLDINMPIMNGWEFLESYGLIEKKGNEKIVLLTSSISPLDKKRAAENPHVVDYRSKPLSTDLLKELISSHLQLV